MREPEERSLTIVHGSLAVGGIEQLIVRFAEVLRQRGWRVQFVLQSRAGTSLHRRAAALGRIHRLPIDYRLAWSLPHRWRIPPTAHIFAPTSDGLTVSHVLRRQAGFHRARVTAGVYFPLEYGNRAVHDLHEIALAVRLLRSAPEENILFMNEACRSATTEALGRGLSRSSIVPVPILLPEAATARARPPGRRLVSIGRLVEFKGYPFGVLEALRALSAEGRHFSYDIYGDGPMRPALEAAIASSGLAGRVRLRGASRPEQFGEICAEALAFIGMGTAAVESAAAGVPTVLAAVGERTPSARGWFADGTGFEVGEARAQEPLVSMTSLLRQVDDVDEGAYAALAAAHRERARAFALPAAATAFERALLRARPHDGAVELRDVLEGVKAGVLDLRRQTGSQRARRAERYVPAPGP